MWQEEEWSREQAMFGLAAKTVLERLVTSGSVRIDDSLFEAVYPELSRRLDKYRGWWNPLASPYTVFYFYRQAVLVLSPVRSREEFSRLYRVDSEVLADLVRNGSVIIMLSGPHNLYTCNCFEELLDAQGVLPTILRVTETLKAVLQALHGLGPWNTKMVVNILQERLGEDARDAATRISDLAALGYKQLAEDLLSMARTRDPLQAGRLVRAFHHVLVEPIIDSGATIAFYTRTDLGFLEKLLESRDDMVHAYSVAVARTIYRLRRESRIVVPRRVDKGKLLRVIGSEELESVRSMIYSFRRVLAGLDESGDVLSEAEEISEVVASTVEREARRVVSGLFEKKIAFLGMISQVPLGLYGVSGEGFLDRVVGAVLSVAGAEASVRGLKALLSRVLARLERIYVLPVTPLVFEVSP